MGLNFSGRVAAMPRTESGLAVPAARVQQETLLRAVEAVGAAGGAPRSGLLAESRAASRDPRVFLAGLAASVGAAADEVADLRAQAEAAYRAGRVTEAVMLAQRAGLASGAARCAGPSVLAYRPTAFPDQLVLSNNVVPGLYSVPLSPAAYGVVSGIGRSAVP